MSVKNGVCKVGNEVCKSKRKPSANKVMLWRQIANSIIDGEGWAAIGKKFGYSYPRDLMQNRNFVDVFQSVRTEREELEARVREEKMEMKSPKIDPVSFFFQNKAMDAAQDLVDLRGAAELKEDLRLIRDVDKDILGYAGYSDRSKEEEAKAKPIQVNIAAQQVNLVEEINAREGRGS